MVKMTWACFPSSCLMQLVSNPKVNFSKLSQNAAIVTAAFECIYKTSYF